MEPDQVLCIIESVCSHKNSFNYMIEQLYNYILIFTFKQTHALSESMKAPKIFENLLFISCTVRCIQLLCLINTADHNPDTHNTLKQLQNTMFRMQVSFKHKGDVA